MKYFMNTFEDSILEFLKYILIMEDTEDKDTQAYDHIGVQIDDGNKVCLVNKEVVGNGEDNQLDDDYMVEIDIY